MISFDEVRTSVREQILATFQNQEQERDTFIRDFNELIKERGIGLENTKPGQIYHLPFCKVDHLSQFKVLVNGQDDFEFPLEKLHCPALDMYFYKRRAPNIVIFIPGRQPSALFTKRGYITLAGGESIEEIIICFCICCFKILFLLNKMYPGKQISVSRFRLCNTVATTALVKQKIRVPALVDTARSFGFKVTYNPDVIGFCYIKPLLPFRRKITFCVSPKGGINILGFRYDYEAQYAMYILSFFLSTCVHRLGPVSKKDIDLKAIQLLEKKIAGQVKKRRAKIKKYTKWIELTKSTSEPRLELLLRPENHCAGEDRVSDTD